jgi:effector-binding domain-containing protein
MNHQCELIERSAQPVLSIRLRTEAEKLPEIFAKSYSALIKYMSELGVMPSGAPFAAYYNMDMQDLDTEIGFPVAKSLPGKGEIQPGEIPSGKFVTCFHVGAYPTLGAAYDALQEFIQQQGYTPSGVAYEFYLNSPTTTPEDELQTQILFPVAEG